MIDCCMILVRKYIEAVPENISMLYYQYMSCKRCCCNSLSIRASRISIRCNLDTRHSSQQLGRNSWTEEALTMDFTRSLYKLNIAKSSYKLSTKCNSSGTANLFRRRKNRQDSYKNLTDYALAQSIRRFDRFISWRKFGKCDCTASISTKMINNIQAHRVDINQNQFELSNMQ